MGERKVLNKYIPPDFDPALMPRFKRDPNKLVEVRMMIPFNMRCNTCGNYMYRGKKFNSKKEDVVGDDYLGIKKFRFIIKCSFCNAQITFKTDPEKGDYECESGASRNFEIWKEKEEVEGEVAKKREEEEKVDAMRALENRTLDSKHEMEILDQLDGIRSLQERYVRVDHDAVLRLIASRQAGGGIPQETDDEQVLRAFREAQNKMMPGDDEEEEFPLVTAPPVPKPVKSANSNPATPAVQLVVKRKTKSTENPTKKKVRKNSNLSASSKSTVNTATVAAPTGSVALGALAAYGGSSEED